LEGRRGLARLSSARLSGDTFVATPALTAGFVGRKLDAWPIVFRGRSDAAVYFRTFPSPARDDLYRIVVSIERPDAFVRRRGTPADTDRGSFPERNVAR
jgi:hypothetical protein